MKENGPGPERPTDLSEIRKQIDTLNIQLIEVIAKRSALIPEVAKFKKENNVPRTDPEREKKILENCKTLANELGVNPILVENIMKLIIEDAHRIEKEIIEE